MPFSSEDDVVRRLWFISSLPQESRNLSPVVSPVQGHVQKDVFQGRCELAPRSIAIDDRLETISLRHDIDDAAQLGRVLPREQFALVEREIRPHGNTRIAARDAGEPRMLSAVPCPYLLGMNVRRARIIAFTLVATFVVIRILLHRSPDSDFNILGYNIHHLYTGLLMITAGGIPLVLFPGNTKLLDAAAATFGAGLSLALDEWVYLIVTDGTNASYLLPVSLRGGIVMVSLATLYIAVLYMVGRRKD